VHDESANLPEDDASPSNGEIGGPVAHNLSGGQKQKIAVARTITRVSSDRDRVGLLLFDEPSASMDPIAEYGEPLSISIVPKHSGLIEPLELFETLRTIRKGKTMIFSTHRYGNLVQHASQIIFMKDSRVVESGTHSELIQLDGGYAKMWKLQAQAFLTPDK
jgi:ABC-type multidrug transport system fused ATPase/permease subunit